MSKINVNIASTGAMVHADELDFGQITPALLIQELIRINELSAPQPGHQYRFVGKQNEILEGSVTLKEAGFNDGDTITLVDKAIAASYYDSENDPADNDPGTGASSGEE
ncbi:MAG: hypothetical protein IJK46_07725 [Prevotella sp.]|nr:hypothetical protein [Prevotella sp.]